MPDQSDRILFIGPFPPPYHGVSVANDILLRSNLNERYRIVTLNTSRGKRFTDMEKFNFRNLWLAAVSIIIAFYHLLSKRFRMVYLPISQNRNAFLRDFVFAGLAKCFRTPILFHLHGGYFRTFYEESSPWLKRMIRWSLRDCAGMIVLGACLKPLFEGLVPEDKLFIVENGIDVNASAKPVPEPERAVPLMANIVYLGNVIEEKGAFALIRIAPDLIIRFPDTVFHFVGEVYDRKRFSEIYRSIQQQDLDKHFRFYGTLTGAEKEAVLAQGDLFCFPAQKSEGQPLVLIEAMAFGLPIITTGIGAIPEMVKHQDNGLLVEPNDADQLKEALFYLLEKPDERERLGRNGRELYLSQYTARHFTDRLLQVVQHILSIEIRGSK